MVCCEGVCCLVFCGCVCWLGVWGGLRMLGIVGENVGYDDWMVVCSLGQVNCCLVWCCWFNGW